MYRVHADPGAGRVGGALVVAREHLHPVHAETALCGDDSGGLEAELVAHRDGAQQPARLLDRHDGGGVERGGGKGVFAAAPRGS